MIDIQYSPWRFTGSLAGKMNICSSIYGRSKCPCVKTQEAKDAGLLHPFVYPNYAARWQKPCGGYGARNPNRLMAIRERYDLQHVFKNLQQACIYLGKLGVARTDLEYCVYGLRSRYLLSYPAVGAFVALQSTGPPPPPP
jgi:hypothetical protein